MPLYTQKEVNAKLREKDKETERRTIQMGGVVFTPEVSDEPGMTKHSEFEVMVHNAPPGKQRRKFDGQKRRHCSGCPFPEGCVMCTLP